MNCNYKPDPKRKERCGAQTVDGAKMCPEHQKKHREYMRQYRKRTKTAERKVARRETLQAIGALVDELVKKEVGARKQDTETSGFSLPAEDPGLDAVKQMVQDFNAWMERYDYA